MGTVGLFKNMSIFLLTANYLRGCIQIDRILSHNIIFEYTELYTFGRKLNKVHNPLVVLYINTETDV